MPFCLIQLALAQSYLVTNMQVHITAMTLGDIHAIIFQDIFLTLKSSYKPCFYNMLLNRQCCLSLEMAGTVITL